MIYRQEQVEAHLSSGRAVFVCATQAEADGLISKGCVATVPNGEWPAIFQGRKIIAVGKPDFAGSIQIILSEMGADVVRLDPRIAAESDRAGILVEVQRLFNVPREPAPSPVAPPLPDPQSVDPDTLSDWDFDDWWMNISDEARAALPSKDRKRHIARKKKLPWVIATPPAAAAPKRRGRPKQRPALEPDSEVIPASDAEQPSDAPIARAYGSLAARWAELGLSCASNGTPHANASNALYVLQRDPSLLGQVWFDTFLQRIQTNSAAPLEWNDGDDIRLMIYMQRDLAIHRMSVETVRSAVIHMAQNDRRNCLQETLRSIELWDNVPRLATFFHDAFGAKNNAYTQAVGLNFWKMLVARAMRPGCKVDNMVVLEGAQGLGKSQACFAIVGKDFFSEAHEQIDNKDFFIALQGKWLVEVTEMDAFSKAGITKVKQVVTCKVDRYRTPYGKHAEDHPRQSVFIGTTNKDDWNRDDTGARRFWPIRCTDINLDYIRQNRNQLFAEAIYRLKAGEDWHTMPNTETKAEQRERYTDDPWTAPTMEYLVGKNDVTTQEILDDAVKLPTNRQQRPDVSRIVAILRMAGWIKGAQQRRNGVVRNIWVRPVEKPES